LAPSQLFLNQPVRETPAPNYIVAQRPFGCTTTLANRLVMGSPRPCSPLNPSPTTSTRSHLPNVFPNQRLGSPVSNVPSLALRLAWRDQRQPSASHLRPLAAPSLSYSDQRTEPPRSVPEFVQGHSNRPQTDDHSTRAEGIYHHPLAQPVQAQLHEYDTAPPLEPGLPRHGDFVENSNLQSTLSSLLSEVRHLSQEIVDMRQNIVGPRNRTNTRRDRGRRERRRTTQDNLMMVCSLLDDATHPSPT